MLYYLIVLVNADHIGKKLLLSVRILVDFCALLIVVASSMLQIYQNVNIWIIIAKQVCQLSCVKKQSELIAYCLYKLTSKCLLSAISSIAKVFNRFQKRKHSTVILSRQFYCYLSWHFLWNIKTSKVVSL